MDSARKDWEKRAEASNRRMDRFERYLARLEKLEKKEASRSMSRRQEHDWRLEHERLWARIDRNLAEITNKLNSLIGDAQSRRPPQQ